MELTSVHHASEIAQLNDLARKGDPCANGLFVMTPGVEAHLNGDLLKRAALARTIATFDTWGEGSDPYAERDFGSFLFDGQQVHFKIDYYDLQLEYGSERPWDPEETRRVITVMLASEY